MKKTKTLKEVYDLWTADKYSTLEFLSSGTLDLRIDNFILSRVDDLFKFFMKDLFENYMSDPLEIVQSVDRISGSGDFSDPGSSLYYLGLYMKSSLSSGLFHTAYMSDLFPVESFVRIQESTRWDVVLEHKDIPDHILVKCVPGIRHKGKYTKALTNKNVNNIDLYMESPSLFDIRELVQNRNLTKDNFDKLTNYIVCHVISESEEGMFWASVVNSKHADKEFVLKYAKQLKRHSFYVRRDITSKFPFEFDLMDSHPALFDIRYPLTHHSYNEDELDILDRIVDENKILSDNSPFLGTLEVNLGYFKFLVLGHQDFSLDYLNEKILKEGVNLMPSIIRETKSNQRLNPETRDHITLMGSFHDSF